MLKYEHPSPKASDLRLAAAARWLQQCVVLCCVLWLAVLKLCRCACCCSTSSAASGSSVGHPILCVTTIINHQSPHIAYSRQSILQQGRSRNHEPHREHSRGTTQSAQQQSKRAVSECRAYTSPQLGKRDPARPAQ